MPAHDVRHLTTDTPRVMVVDGSKLVRRLIGDMLQRDLPGVDVIGCAGLSEAKAALEAGPVDLVTTSLVLMDGDGLQVARHVRTSAALRAGDRGLGRRPGASRSAPLHRRRH